MSQAPTEKYFYDANITLQTVAVAPTQYFLRRRGLANGIVLAGGGAGGAIISVALNAIIHRLGLAWAFRIHCLVVAGTGLPAAFLIQERVPYKPCGLVDWYVSLEPYTRCAIANCVRAGLCSAAARLSSCSWGAPLASSPSTCRLTVCRPLPNPLVSPAALEPDWSQVSTHLQL